MAHFTFDRGRIFRRVVDTPLPAWAAEFDARTWAQFFLKYVISHPDVTVARTGTTKAAHMLENLGAGIGRLPNASMRKRMAEFVDALPLPQRTAPSSSQGRTVMTPELAKEMDAKLAPTVALPAATLDRYAGEYTHAAVGTNVTIRRAGDRLVAEVHGSAMTPIPFVARSETRFASASIYNLEFQLDGQGNATGATWEQLKERIALQRR